MNAEKLSASFNAVYFESIDSTNEAVKRMAQDAGDGLVVVADAQSAGRGRKGREWISPAGKNLYFSLLLKPDFAPDKASMLTLVMAVAVRRAVQEICGDAFRQDDLAQVWIKWPNDIVCGGRKLAGILTEMQLRDGAIDYVVIGVGVNVKRQEFPLETCAHAASLSDVCDGQISRTALLQSILKHFTDCYDCFQKTYDLSGLLAEYNASLVNTGRTVRVLDPAGEFSGEAQGINEKGELMVRTADGIQNVYAGEVSVRGVYGYV